MKTTTITDRIWTYLRSKGLTENGTAGLMGNLYSESGCMPDTVEELLIQRYDEEKSKYPTGYNSGYKRPVNNYDNILYNNALYLKRWKDGTVTESEFLSPRSYTGVKHQYGYGLVQWTTRSRKQGLLDLCKKKGTDIDDLETQLEYLLYELVNTYPTVLKYLKGDYSLNDCSDIVLTRFEAPANASAMKSTRRNYARFYLDAYKGKVQNTPKLTADSFLSSVANVYQMAHKNHWKYGDSQALPPCNDGIISCDRLVARALYDLGFTDQPHKDGQGRSGICVDQMDSYLPKWGFVKSTDILDCKKGGVVVVNQNGKPYHVFVLTAVNGTKCDKYDTGSQTRIDSVQPFTNVLINEWADRTFGAVYNLPEEKKEEKMGFDIQKLIAVAEAEVGYLEKASNSYLDSKTTNAGSNNYTKYWRDMKPSYQGQAWCDCFVDWCFVKAYGKANAQILECGGCGEYYTPTSAQCYKNKKQWFTSPKVGDQIFFKNSTRICHTGIVYKVDSNTVYTIEGNTSGASGVISNGGGVCKKSYPKGNSKIAGYGRPNYGTQLQNVTSEGKYMVNIYDVYKGCKDGSVVYTLRTLLRGRGMKGDNGELLKLGMKCDEDCIHAINSYQKARINQGSFIGGGADGKTPDGCFGFKCWNDITGGIVSK